MVAKRFFFICAGILLLAIGPLAWPARAFDGSRKGFILGAGAGVGVSSYTQKLEDQVYGFPPATSDQQSNVGFATDFRIGWGASKQVLVFYDNKVNWFGFDNAFGNTVTIADGLTSAGISYYLKRAFPSAYLTGGFGWAAWSTPLEENSSGSVGFGLFGGAGFEFTRLLNVEGTISYGMPSNEESGLKLTTNSLCLRVELMVLAY